MFGQNQPAAAFNSNIFAVAPTTTTTTSSTTSTGIFATNSNASSSAFGAGSNPAAGNMELSPRDAGPFAAAATSMTASSAFGGFGNASAQPSSAGSGFGSGGTRVEGSIGSGTVAQFGAGTGSVFHATQNTMGSGGTVVSVHGGSQASGGTSTFGAGSGSLFGPRTTTNTFNTSGGPTSSGGFGTASQIGSLKPGEGTQFGSGTGTTFGSGSGMGNQFGSGSGTGTQFGSGSGTGTQFGSGSDTGTQFGPGSGTGTQFGPGSGTGTQFGSSGSGTGTHFGSGSSSGIGTQFGSGTGTGTQFGSGSSTGPPQFGSGPGSAHPGSQQGSSLVFAGPTASSAPASQAQSSIFSQISSNAGSFGASGFGQTPHPTASAFTKFAPAFNFTVDTTQAQGSTNNPSLGTSSLFGQTAAPGESESKAKSSTFASSQLWSSNTSSQPGASVVTTQPFGGALQTTTGGSVFGSKPGGIFGSITQGTSSSGQTATGNLFGGQVSSAPSFGMKPPAPPTTTTAAPSSLFAQTTSQSLFPRPPGAGSNMFGQPSQLKDPKQEEAKIVKRLFVASGDASPTAGSVSPLGVLSSSEAAEGALRGTTTREPPAYASSAAAAAGGMFGGKIANVPQKSVSLFGRAVTQATQRASEEQGSKQPPSDEGRRSISPLPSAFGHKARERSPSPATDHSNPERGRSSSPAYLFGKQVREGSHSPGPSHPESSADDTDNQGVNRKIVLRRKQGEQPRMKQGTVSIKDRLGRPEKARADEGDSTPEKRILRRRSTVDEVSTKVAIVCKNVPQGFNNKTILRKHFSKFGKVTRLITNTVKGTASVHFQTHEEAENAWRKGRTIRAGFPPLTIFWSSHTPMKDSGGSHARPREDGSRGETARPAESHGDKQSRQRSSKPSARTVLKPAASDLDDELQSMRGTADIGGSMRLLERPRETSRVSSRDNRWAKPTATGGPSKQQHSPPPPASRKSHDTAVASQSKSKNADAKAAIARAPPPTAKPEKGVAHISLKGLTDAIANTAGERYAILENRDKIVRLAVGSGKHADLATAKAIQGTCPDMCPEKERYVREDRRRLNAFEMVPGTDTVDHSRAVKEYSRSSADQDMPLPHELRPPPVLEMTMHHLLRSVADQGGDGRWDGWYEYLWDRTRGIRKDITQQHLCDLISVALTEKCSRFHIYSAERLCEEDMMVFDSQINDENLTKCLQTLKEQYTDMSSKQSTLCPCESEFRAYMVLMNLNQGDILREVQQLREEVRELPEMKFVVEVYSAVNSNNYVKFFKLVRRAPFLYACLMHRYFNQVRTKALQTMLKAYRKAGRPSQYPISEMMRQLGFENSEEGAEFCRHHGLTTDGTHVLLDRATFVFPEVAFGARRAVQLIEAKQTHSVGEVINGAPIPPPPDWQPQISFDANGRFIAADIYIKQETQAADSTAAAAAAGKAAADVTAASVAAEAEVTVSSSAHGTFVPAAFQPVVTPQSQEPQEAHDAPESETRSQAQEKLAISNEVVKEVTKELFVEVIKEMAVTMSQSLVATIQHYLQSDQAVYGDLQEEVMLPLVREVCESAQSECDGENQERLARERAELAARKNAAASDLVDDLVNEVIDETSQQVACNEIQLVHAQLSEESVRRASERVVVELLQEVVQEQTADVADHVFEVDVAERLDVLAACERATQLLLLNRQWKRWKNRYAGQLRLKRSMLTFPPAPSLKSPEELFESLLPGSEGLSQRSLHLGMNAHATLATSAELVREERGLRRDICLYNYWRHVRHERAWAPLDLPKLLGRGLSRAVLTQRAAEARGRQFNVALYSKLVLSVTEEGNDDDSADDADQLCDWLKAKLRKGAVPNPDQSGKTDVLSLYTVPVQSESCYCTLGICVRCVNGILEQEEAKAFAEKRHLLGTSGIILCLANDEDPNEALEEAELRLERLSQSLPSATRVPLLVVTNMALEPHDTRCAESCLSQNQAVSDCRILDLARDIEDPETSDKLSEGLQWLATHACDPPKITSKALQDYAEDLLTTEFFTPVYQDLRRRRTRGYLDQGPGVLVHLYNTVVKHLADTASDPQLQSLSWPVPEFASSEANLPDRDWNSYQQLEFVEESLLALTLPEFDAQDDVADSWQDACRDVWAYVHAVGDEDGETTQLYSKVRWILHKHHVDFEDLCLDTLRLNDCDPTYVNIPWTDVVVACVDCRLTQTSMLQQQHDLQIHYQGAALEKYKPPAAWLDACLDVVTEQGPSLQETMLHSAGVSSKRKLEDTASSTSKEALSKQAKVDGGQTSLDLTTLSESQLVAGDTVETWKATLAEEKDQTAQYEEYLQRALIDDPLAAGFEQCFGSPQYHAVSQRQSFASPRAAEQGLAQSRLTSADSHPPATNRGSSLLDDLQTLSSSLHSQKQADKLFEMRLRSFLTDSSLPIHDSEV